jgi:hypothetical protein
VDESFSENSREGAYCWSIIWIWEATACSTKIRQGDVGKIWYVNLRGGCCIYFFLIQGKLLCVSYS